jgi:hypothetical protein
LPQASGPWLANMDWTEFWTGAGAVANFAVAAVAVGVVMYQRRNDLADRVNDRIERTIELLKASDQAAWEIGNSFSMLNANARSAEISGHQMEWETSSRVKVLRRWAATLASLNREGVPTQMITHASSVQYLLLDAIEVLRRYAGTTDKTLLFELLNLKNESDAEMDANEFFTAAMNRKPGDPPPTLS